MSEQVKETKKFTVRDLVWVLVGVVAGILIGWAVFTTTLSDSVEDIGVNTQSEVSSTVDTTNGK